MIGLIRTTTHDRIVAEKDAEIAGLMKRLTLIQTHRELVDSLLRTSEARNSDLRRQLAVFTGPRQRGPRGRFLSTKEQV
ncbi:MAG: hypothetical protein EOO77_19435, partial [Oxalobacteraceae bacterium]